MVGAGRFERPTPWAQDIGSYHLRINRFNNLQTLLVVPCRNFSYNLDCKAAIRLVKPPTKPTESPAGSADCKINQRGRAHVVTAGGCACLRAAKSVPSRNCSATIRSPGEEIVDAGHSLRTRGFCSFSRDWMACAMCV